MPFCVFWMRFAFRCEKMATFSQRIPKIWVGKVSNFFASQSENCEHRAQKMSMIETMISTLILNRVKWIARSSGWINKYIFVSSQIWKISGSPFKKLSTSRKNQGSRKTDETIPITIAMLLRIACQNLRTGVRIRKQFFGNRNEA